MFIAYFMFCCINILNPSTGVLIMRGKIPLALTGIGSDLPTSRQVCDPVSERGELWLPAKAAPTGQPTDGTLLREMLRNG